MEGQMNRCIFSPSGFLISKTSIMKSAIRIFLLISILSPFIISCNQNTDTPLNRIKVSGTILNFKDTAVVFSYDSYELLSTTQKPVVKINPDGTFLLEIESSRPLKGYFSFGRVPFTYNFDIRLVNGQDSSLSVESADFRMVYLWLEPGNDLTMNLDVEKISETLAFSGTGALNNRFVNEEENRFNDYRHKYLGNYYNYTNRTPDDFKKVTNDLRDEKLNFLKNYEKANPLSTWLKNVYASEYSYGAITSKIYYPGSHAGFNDGREALLPGDYFSFLDSINLTGDIGDLGIGYYYYLNSSLHKKYDLELSSDPETGEFYAYIKSHLPGRLAYEFLAYALARDFKKSLYNEFGTDCPYPDIAALVKEKYQHLEGMLEGNPAPEITLPDVNGKIVSINEFRGKFVYFDFWATWCGPCVKEIPSLKIIEKEYRGKNIQFVSISYDKPGDLEKWKRYVVENSLTGIQLIADQETHDRLNKIFNIDLIPRFILIDPQGNIVNANAPRPSSPKLKELFGKMGL